MQRRAQRQHGQQKGARGGVEEQTQDAFYAQRKQSSAQQHGKHTDTKRKDGFVIHSGILYAGLVHRMPLRGAERAVSAFYLRVVSLDERNGEVI